MIQDLYNKLKNFFTRGNATIATTKIATVQVGDQVLQNVPVLHLAGLKMKPQIGQDMLLIAPAGELDHAVALNLASQNQDMIQIYNILNELLKALNNAALNPPPASPPASPPPPVPPQSADNGVFANSYLSVLKIQLTALQKQLTALNPASNVTQPLDFLLK